MGIMVMPIRFLTQRFFTNYYCAFACEKFLMAMVIGVPTLIDFMKNSHAYDYQGAYAYSKGYSTNLAGKDKSKVWQD